MRLTHVQAIDVTAQLRGRADDPDAAVRVGHTSDGRVALLMDPDAADRLARLLARFDAIAPTELPDRSLWMPTVVDLLAARAFARCVPVPVEVAR